jgi:hypothetical protein
MIVRTYAEQGQENASSLEQRLEYAHQRVRTIRQALQAGNALAAQDEQQQLGGDIDAISLLVGGSLGIMNSIEGQTNDGKQTRVSADNQAIEGSLSQLQKHHRAGSISRTSELPVELNWTSLTATLVISRSN